MLKTTISYAISAEGERVHVDDVDLSKEQLFLCETCRSSLQAFTTDWGGRHFVHTLHNNLALCLAVNCPSLEPPKRMLKTPTVIQSWKCMICDMRYQGTKMCPRCCDWVNTVAVRRW